MVHPPSSPPPLGGFWLESVEDAAGTVVRIVEVEPVVKLTI